MFKKLQSLTYLFDPKDSNEHDLLNMRVGQRGWVLEHAITLFDNGQAYLSTHHTYTTYGPCGTRSVYIRREKDGAKILNVCDVIPERDFAVISDIEPGKFIGDNDLRVLNVGARAYTLELVFLQEDKAFALTHKETGFQVATIKHYQNHQTRRDTGWRMRISDGLQEVECPKLYHEALEYMEPFLRTLNGSTIDGQNEQQLVMFAEQFCPIFNKMMENIGERK